VGGEEEAGEEQGRYEVEEEGPMWVKRVEREEEGEKEEDVLRRD
jgi:hypothetical protein